MSPALIWLVGGVALLVLEMLLPGVFLMWLGLAALVTGALVHVVEPGLHVQVIVFALAAAISIAVALRLRRPRRAASLNTATSGLIGRKARVLVITPSLRVRVGDSDWAARMQPGDGAPNCDDVLDVVDVEGTTVVLGTSASKRA